MVSGEDSSRHVIEAMLACSAQVSLPAPLALVVAVADDSFATALGADNAFRPSELTNDFITLRFVEQVRQLRVSRRNDRFYISGQEVENPGGSEWKNVPSARAAAACGW
jgi:hypothetical protein